MEAGNPGSQQNQQNPSDEAKADAALNQARHSESQWEKIGPNVIMFPLFNILNAGSRGM